MSEKTELEIAKQTLKNSKDPAEREKVQQKYDALLEKDIASDKEVIAACGNGNAGSSACASARLKVIASKEGYEDGPYRGPLGKRKISHAKTVFYTILYRHCVMVGTSLYPD